MRKSDILRWEELRHRSLSGQRIKIERLKFRKTTDEEVLRCCCQTGDDIQSGPHFCSQLAEYVSWIDDTHYVGLCNFHKPKKEQIICQ